MRNAQQSETYAVGVDFGTESGRAVVVRGCNGERPPDPVRKGLEGKTATATGTGTVTKIAPTKIESRGGPVLPADARRGSRTGMAGPKAPPPERPRVAVVRGLAGHPLDISKVALFASGAVLRGTRAFTGKAEMRSPFNSLRTNPRASRARSISVTPAALAGPQERSGGLATARKDRFLGTDGRGRAGGPDRTRRRRERPLRRV